MQIHTIDELTNPSAQSAAGSGIRGKYILLRSELNVQIVDGVITEPFRIDQSMPTIRRLAGAGARVAICAHLGRPDGVVNPEFSLRPVAEYMKIPLIPDCLDKSFLPGMKDGDVVLLENVRFYAAEEKNDPEFVAKLAAGFDIYVNDAFGVSHRAHASTAGVARVLPAYAGELLASEIKTLSNMIENPVRPLVAMIGGAKPKSKIDVIRALCNICDHVICAGGIGTGFYAAMGMKNLAMDAKNLEKIDIDTDNEIREIMDKFGDKIILPVDKGVGAAFDRNTKRTDKKMADILPTDVPLDEGPGSVAKYSAAIDAAATVVWNGTLGLAEWAPVWSAGTFACARHIAQRTRAGKLISIVGGGDAVASLEAAGGNIKDDITYVSTGGGAFLEFIEGRALPGIKALEK